MLKGVTSKRGTKMDREREVAHLAHVERMLAAGERHIADQEQRVAQLDRDGRDTKGSVSLLALYRRLQAQRVALRHILLKQLQQDAERAKPDDGPIFRPGHYAPQKIN
jgi:hypothetical protein